MRCDYEEPGIKWDLSPTGNHFDGLDSLDRVVDCLWRKYSSPTGDPVGIGYTYDRANNRTSRKVFGGTGNDELYAYDNLDRLRDFTRGDLFSWPLWRRQVLGRIDSVLPVLQGHGR